MLARAGYLAIAFALLTSQACVLDWKLPEPSVGGVGGMGGGAGGLPFDPLCCKVCHPAPSECRPEDKLPFDLAGPCTGFYFERTAATASGGQEPGSCHLLVDCACEVCEPLPDSAASCESFVLNQCNGCLID